MTLAVTNVIVSRQGGTGGKKHIGIIVLTISSKYMQTTMDVAVD